MAEYGSKFYEIKEAGKKQEKKVEKDKGKEPVRKPSPYHPWKAYFFGSKKKT